MATLRGERVHCVETLQLCTLGHEVVLGTHIYPDTPSRFCQILIVSIDLVDISVSCFYGRTQGSGRTSSSPTLECLRLVVLCLHLVDEYTEVLCLAGHCIVGHKTRNLDAHCPCAGQVVFNYCVDNC